MAGLWSNTSQIKELFKQHTSKVEVCLSVFIEGVIEYIQTGNKKRLTVVADDIHNLESEADKIRRKVVHLLIDDGYLLPNTRRDFLTLLEDIDKVADYSEAVVDYISLQDFNISSHDKNRIIEMLNITKKQYKLLAEAVTMLFDDIDEAFKLVVDVDKLESEVDKLERDLITRFTSRENIETAVKLLYRDFIIMLANISDKIEDAGDQIEIIVAVRGI